MSEFLVKEFSLFFFLKESVPDSPRTTMVEVSGT